MITNVDILSQPLFLNSYIQYKDKSLYIKSFINGKLVFLVDLLQNKHLMNFHDIQQSIDTYPGLLFDHNAIVNAIPKNWKLQLTEIDDQDIQKAISRTATIPEIAKQLFEKDNKIIRKVFNNSKCNIPCSQNFWKNKLNVDISNHFDIAIHTSSETRLRLLHFKILHNIYPTNIMLKKMKIKESHLCETCGTIDYTEHFFVECNKLNGFWSFICNKILIDTGIRITLTTNNILFGVSRKDVNKISSTCLRYINYIILIGKMCISKFKYGKIKNLSMIFEHEFHLRRNQIPRLAI